MRYFKILKNFIKKNKEEEQYEEESVQDHEMYVSDENVSATIEIRLDSQTGDFNVVVGVSEVDLECSKNLALVLYMLNSGHLSEYFTQAYENWSADDPSRQVFIKDLFLNWIINKETYSEKKDKLAIAPADVFSFSDYVDK
tara:strand:+ start:25 stop:447 length:423 start_codon:yes stop_codon:yes gene_type:complete